MASSTKLDPATLAYIADLLEREGFPRASVMLWELTKSIPAPVARDAVAAPKVSSAK
jgi:hypothetical protein